MKPRNEPTVQPARPRQGHDLKRKRLQIVKLEERIAPRIATNHNETLVRDVG